MDEMISVIVPIYNSELYIKRCLDSIVNQTYKTLEIILVNDGSSDDSLIICQQYQEMDSRIKLITQENGGQSKARNTGLQSATGKYIGFVDCDDWIEPDMYEYLMTLIKMYETDIAVCDYIRHKTVMSIKQPTELIKKYNKYDLLKEFYRVDGGKSSFAVWNRLYKKEVVDGVFFCEGMINEDVDYMYSIYNKIDSAVFSNQIKYNYYINPIGTTESKLCQKDFSQFKIWDNIVQCENGTEYYEYAVLNRKRATFNLYMKAKLSGIGADIDKSVLKEWKKELKCNYKDLVKGKMLDYKRKIALFLICKTSIL